MFPVLKRNEKSRKSELEKSIEHQFGKFGTYFLRKILAFPTDALGVFDYNSLRTILFMLII